MVRRKRRAVVLTTKVRPRFVPVSAVDFQSAASICYLNRAPDDLVRVSGVSLKVDASVGGVARAIDHYVPGCGCNVGVLVVPQMFPTPLR